MKTSFLLYLLLALPLFLKAQAVPPATIDSLAAAAALGDTVHEADVTNKLQTVAADTSKAKKQLPTQPSASGNTKPAEVMADYVKLRSKREQNDTILYDLGKQNAKLYFQRPWVFTSAAYGSMLGILTAGITLAVPITLAIVPPKIKEKDVPDRALLQSPSYMAGYTAGAKKKKRLTVLKGTGVGVGGAAVLVGFIYLLIAGLSEPL